MPRSVPPHLLCSRAQVLCKKDTADERWENATIRSIEVNGGSHTTYTLESWREMRGIPQVAVLATDGGMGAGAVLRNVCELGKQELAQILLECSINLWQADLKGNTALILAASHGHDASG